MDTTRFRFNVVIVFSIVVALSANASLVSAELKINAVYPTLGVMGSPLNINVQGSDL